jgi:hypothetical protein
MVRTGFVRAAAFGALVSSRAWGGILYTAQERTITVATSADGAVQTAAAADFGVFSDLVSLQTNFALPGGGLGVNAAEAGIDCQLDPNRIKLWGSVFGAGGVGATGVVSGRASVVLSVNVTLGASELVSVASRPRPNVNPEDVFKVKVRRTGNGGGVVLLVDQRDAPTALDTLVHLPAGDYSVEYQAEVTVVGGEATSDVGFLLMSRSADLNSDGAVNTLDLVRFLGKFGSSGLNSWSEGTEADLNGDGNVDTADLVVLLGRFGEVGGG